MTTGRTKAVCIPESYCIVRQRSLPTGFKAKADRRVDYAGRSMEITQRDSVLKPRRGREGGHAVLEAAFLMPWLIFLFIGAFDMGFYSYALICTENAARVATMYTPLPTPPGPTPAPPVRSLWASLVRCAI